MFWIRAFAFFWLLYSVYDVYRNISQKHQVDRVKSLADTEELDKFNIFSPNFLCGVTVLIFFVLLSVDLAGFAVVKAYIPLSGIREWIFYAIFALYCYSAIKNGKSTIKFGRMFFRSDRTFSVMVRYIKVFRKEPSVLSSFISYGKCLVAVDLYWFLIFGSSL